MADIGGSQNSEFGAGISHVTNAGRGNDNSITLGGALQADSDRWNSITPHSVIHTALNASSQDDTSFERVQREAGGYAPGSMPQVQDQLDQGTDDNTL